MNNKLSDVASHFVAASLGACAMAAFSAAIVMSLHPQGATAIEPIPMAGQVWEYDLNRGDPFSKPDVRRYVVDAVKDGFVQYHREGETALQTSRIAWFEAGSTLVK